MRRFFVEAVNGDTARLSDEDAAHACRVLRLKAGDAVTLCDGRGTDYDAVLTLATPAEAVCCVTDAHPSDTEPRCRVTLYQCLPKAGKLEIVIQKGTELGAAAFVPVQSRFCVPEPKDFSKRLPRFQRVALEAAKQSRRGCVPAVSGLTGIAQIDPAAHGLFLIAYENEQSRMLKAALRERELPDSVGVLIGPEGGLAPEEVALLSARGALSVSLGPRILRTETAGAAVLSQILYEAEP